MRTLPPRRAGRAVALAAALLALPAARANAQACAAGTLEAYLVAGFSCTLGGFTFSSFDFDPPTTSDGSGFGGAPGAANISLTPFTGTDAQGRTTFGFSFINFQALAGVSAGDAGAGRGEADVSLSFLAEALDPSTVISRAGYAFSLSATTATPDRTSLASNVFGEVVGDPVGLCLIDVRDRQGPTSFARSVASRCLPLRPTQFVTQLAVGAAAERGESARTGAGSVQAGISSVTYTLPGQVVPEPATVVLVAAGGLALAAGARRARR